MKRLALILVTLVALSALAAGSAAAYFSAHGKASQRFHVSEGGGDVQLDIDSITGALDPGESLTVRFTVTNSSGWTVRVGRVRADDPAITGLPDGCAASNFDFDPVNVNAKLGPNEHVSDSGRLRLVRGADQDCAGADPVLHLVIG